MADPPTTDAAAAQAADSRRWLSLAATCTAAGMVWLAFADLGVAIPTIADAFDANLSTLQWANNAFSLVAGALVIAAGKFGDVYGRRRMLQLGILVFAAFSIVAAAAQGVGTLILGRGLMGIGAALILPATLALIPPQFSGKAQLTAFGIWQAVAWGGQAVGPAIGGVITDGLGWRWLFWINLPLAAGAFLVIRALTPESSDPDASSRTDWPGLATIGLAVFALLYALTDGPSRGWGDPLVDGLLVLSVVLAIAWVLIERRSPAPLVDLKLFRIRPYDGALTANLTMNLAFAGLSYVLVLWLQNARGYDAVEAGLLMLPSTVGIFAFIPLGGRLAARRGDRLPVLAGLMVLAAGLFVLGFLNADSGLGLMAGALVVIGLGLGLLSTPVSNTAVGDVPGELAGTAAGVFKMSSMVGGALGVAVLTAFARAFTRSDAGDALRAAGLSSSQITQAHDALVGSSSFQEAIASLPRDLGRSVTNAVIDAFSSGVAQSMVVTGVVAVVATGVVAWLWPRRRNRAAASPSPAAEPEGSTP
ncbi:MAG TPA: MFS transporter [Acidimicrobiales bacterium]|nr:MFS transporter [Acidimicrobiales bacterium]